MNILREMTVRIGLLRLMLPMLLLMTTYAGAAGEPPLTFEQAREMALARVPGVVVDTERSIHNGAVVYEFDIRQENGAVIDIEIDSVTRQVLELKFDRIGSAATLPEPEVTAAEAGEIAAAHVRKNTTGLRGVDIEASEYKLVDGLASHVVRMRRGIERYESVVDAQTGVVRSFREVKR